MQTLAGRTVFRIFAENLIVSSITFHGGTNSITYPWGSNNHISTINRRKGAEAPDHTALDSGAQMLVQAAGETFNTASNSRIIKYAMGDMTSVVYPVGGGMEDWAYGAGWDTQQQSAAI